MKLSVLERIQLLGLLPKEGDHFTLKILRQLKESLSFSEAEHKVLQFKNGGEKYKDDKGREQIVPEGQIRWIKEADKDVQIGERATDIITEIFKKLNDQKKLPEQMFDLYEKFIEVK